MEMHPVEGNRDIYKDPTTGVLVNRNVSDRNRYLIAKQQARQQVNGQQEISQLKREVRELKELKGEIDDLKQMIQMLLDK